MSRAQSRPPSRQKDRVKGKNAEEIAWQTDFWAYVKQAYDCHHLQ